MVQQLTSVSKTARCKLCALDRWQTLQWAPHATQAMFCFCCFLYFTTEALYADTLKLIERSSLAR